MAGLVLRVVAPARTTATDTAGPAVAVAAPLLATVEVVPTLLAMVQAVQKMLLACCAHPDIESATTAKGALALILVVHRDTALTVMGTVS